MIPIKEFLLICWTGRSNFGISSRGKNKELKLLREKSIHSKKSHSELSDRRNETAKANHYIIQRRSCV